MSLGEVLTALADAIRLYTNGSKKLSLEGMVSEIKNVFDTGTENGKKVAYDNFWDIFQSNGGATSYYWAFSYNRWKDSNYNPKYTIKGSSNGNSLSNTFYSSGITDTRVDIDTYNATSINGMFYWAKSLETIRKLKMSEKVTSAKTAFSECFALKNLTIDGVIACDFDIHWSPLSKESVTSIITHLSDTTTGLTVTLEGFNIQIAFASEPDYQDGDTTEEWLNLVASKPNWNISLV